MDVLHLKFCDVAGPIEEEGLTMSTVLFEYILAGVLSMSRLTVVVRNGYQYYAPFLALLARPTARPCSEERTTHPSSRTPARFPSFEQHNGLTLGPLILGKVSRRTRACDTRAHNDNISLSR
jgi:hypothetical protein